MSLTGLEVVSSISQNIYNSFSREDIANIYKDKPTQGMIKPCAFIHQIEASHTKEMRNRGSMTFNIDVRVHPKDGEQDIHSWGSRIGLRMTDALMGVTVSGQKVRPQNIRWTVQEDVLHVITSYDMKVISIEDSQPLMADLYNTERVK